MSSGQAAEGDTSGPLVGVCGRLRGVEPYERNSFLTELTYKLWPLQDFQQKNAPSSSSKQHCRRWQAEGSASRGPLGERSLQAIRAWTGLGLAGRVDTSEVLVGLGGTKACIWIRKSVVAITGI